MDIPYIHDRYHIYVDISEPIHKVACTPQVCKSPTHGPLCVVMLDYEGVGGQMLIKQVRAGWHRDILGK